MGRGARAARRHPRTDDVARPPALPRPRVRPGVGGVPGPRDAGAQPLGRGPPRRVRRQHGHLPGRGRVVGVPAHVVPALLGRVRTLPRAEVRDHRERGVLGARPAVEVGHVPRRRSHHQEAGGPARGQGVEAAERLLRPQRVHRRVDDEPRGGPPAVRHRRRQPHVGQRLPPPRRHVAQHRPAVEGDVPRRARRRRPQDARRCRRVRVQLRRGRAAADRRRDRPHTRGPGPGPEPGRRPRCRPPGALVEGRPGRAWDGRWRDRVV